MQARGFTAAMVLSGILVLVYGDLRAAAESPVAPAPLFGEATNEFQGMTMTVYQHGTRVDRSTGRYGYDCVGFVSYALKQAAPQAWRSVAKATGLAPGRIPSPPKYRRFFAGLADAPQAGWEPVGKAADLRPGDVVAWEHRTATSSGHAVIIGGLPSEGPENSWVVRVYDSTSSPHTEDSRRTDRRAQVLASSGRPSGLGYGVMVFIADPSSGALKGLRWGVKGKIVTVPIAAGRPTS